MPAQNEIGAEAAPGVLWSAWPEDDCDGDPRIDPMARKVTEWFIGRWPLGAEEPECRVLIGEGRSAELLARRLAEKLTSILNTDAIRAAALSAPGQPVPEEVRRLSDLATQGLWSLDDKSDDFVRINAAGHSTWRGIEKHVPWSGLARFVVKVDGADHPTGVANAKLAVHCVNYVRTLLSAQPTKPTGEDAGADASDTDVIRALEQELGRYGIVNVFRASLALAKQAAAKARTEGTPAPVPIPADGMFLPLDRRPSPREVGQASNILARLARQTDVEIAALARPSEPGEGLREAAESYLRDFTRFVREEGLKGWPEHNQDRLIDAVNVILSRPDTAGEGRRPIADDLARWLVERAMLDPTPAEFAARALLERDDSPLRASLSPDTAGDGEGLERVRHVKRGTEYEVLFRGVELQASSTLENEGVDMVIYRGKDGRLWAREEDEFDDGRFERLDRAAPSSQGEG